MGQAIEHQNLRLVAYVVQRDLIKLGGQFTQGILRFLDFVVTLGQKCPQINTQRVSGCCRFDNRQICTGVRSFAQIN